MPLERAAQLGPYRLIAPLASDPDALARFEREAKAVASLSHPNMLAIYDFTDDEVQQQIGDDVELEFYPQHRGG